MQYSQYQLFENFNRHHTTHSYNNIETISSFVETDKICVETLFNMKIAWQNNAFITATFYKFFKFVPWL